MKRRDFLVLAGVVAAFPRVAFGQQAAKVPRVAYLSIPLSPQTMQAFQQGLGDFGYIDGKNIGVELFTAPTTNDLPAFASKAAASKPDVIWAFGTSAGQAAKGVTDTIPIVFADSTDPLGGGLIASLAHPGGNITGTSLLSPDLIGKQLAIMKEVVPTMKQIVVFNLPEVQPTARQIPAIRAVAQAVEIEPVIIDFVEGQDLVIQFGRVLAAGAQAVYVTESTYFNTNRDLLYDLQLKNRLPMISASITPGGATPFIGVVSYGPSATGPVRRSASYIAAILKGARPGDLPVEQPTVFDFDVNLFAAKQIGLAIPPSILAQATLVIDYDLRAPPGAPK